jgi:hypothetical protein
MRMNKKIILYICIAVLVIAGVSWYVLSTNNSLNISPEAQNNDQTLPTNDIISNDSSDAGLNKDLSNIDKQTNEFSADNKNIEDSLNDQPITQGQ